MICARCDEPMTDEEAVAYAVPGASGPGITIHVHRVLCDIPATTPRRYPTPPC
ncbi:hypothetical protein [Streptomyces sp. NPDC059783]|uniref:hypothetical protein n=1 Tax=Streptomyces sp. NPDC059783 TaxID=3346944 RepID=UPI00366930AC